MADIVDQLYRRRLQTLMSLDNLVLRVESASGVAVGRVRASGRGCGGTGSARRQTSSHNNLEHARRLPAWP